MQKNRVSQPLIIILLGGFALRLYRLGAQSLWYDETVSAVLAQKSVAELIAHTARDIHPPGYYLLLHFWTQIAGNTEFALAYFSLIFGVLLIAASYRLGVRLVGQRGALWGAAMVAFSPYNLWYSQELRMYTLGAFLGVATVFFAWQFVHRRGKRNALGYVFASALGLYTLYYFAFLLIALNLFLLIILFRNSLSFPRAFSGNLKDKFRRGWRQLGEWLAINIAVLILYLPWIPIAWRQATHPPVPPWRSEIPLWRIALESWNALSLGESIQPQLAFPILILTAILFVIGLRALPSAKVRRFLPTLVFGSLAIIVFLPIVTGSPLYHVRYLFTYSPAFYLIIGAGMAQLWRKWQKLAMLSALLWLAGSGFAIAQLHTNSLYAADDLRGAVNFLQKKWRPGDVILVDAGYTYTALQYYWAGGTDGYFRLTDFDAGLQQNPYRPLVLMAGTVDGDPNLGWGDPRSDFFAMSKTETESALAAVSENYPRIWLLRAYDTVTDPRGDIRHWLAQSTLQFEDYAVGGASNFRVQGFATNAESSPPQRMSATFADKFRLLGIIPLGQNYHPADTIFVTWWLENLQSNSDEPPYVVSLKLWDSEGDLAAQVDEWATGNLHFSPTWQAGEVIRYPMALQLPADLSAGQYWLDMIIYRSDGGEPLSVTERGESGVTLGGIRVQ